MSAQRGPNPNAVEITLLWQAPGRLRPKWLSSGQAAQMLSQLGPNQPIWAQISQFGPTRARHRLTLAPNVGQTWPHVDQTCLELGQIRPTPAMWQGLDQFRAEIDKVRPGFIQIWATRGDGTIVIVGRIFETLRIALSECGRTRPNTDLGMFPHDPDKCSTNARSIVSSMCLGEYGPSEKGLEQF